MEIDNKINRMFFFDQHSFITFIFSLANTSLINNHTIELRSNLEMLCHNNQNMTSIEQYLTDLLIKFKINKSKFSVNSRRLLRKRFSQLAEQCQMQNASKEIILLAIKLADHAYKLPERMK